ncbi:acetamidase/formamidase family protein [Mycobacterium sp. THU-M104]|uniref:acetamidase/formamidase family protein n=1 Tax=Mycobacterium sp. THU-M104 TaxID=3410515 RepID=UPI003BA21DA3
MHCLSGAFAIEGAEPGDLLIVDILDVGPILQKDSGPLAGQGWGYTGIFSTLNGGGFLTDRFPDAYKAIWDFAGQSATSRHIPGVKYTGTVHPGLIGTAPSVELLATWNRREGALIATDPQRVPPLVLAPLPRARTAEIRISRTSPKAVGLRSDRDGWVHRLTRRRDQRRHGDLRRARTRDLHARQHRTPAFGVDRLLGHVGDTGWRTKISGLRSCVSARMPACHRLSDEIRLQPAPIEGRLSGVVDIPNSCATVYIPAAIFDFPVVPSASGPHRIDSGIGAPHASS